MKKSEGLSRCVRIYLDLSSSECREKNRATATSVVETLRDSGCAGAIVFDGYGGSWGADFSTRAIPIVPSESALIVEWVDTANRVESILPSIISLLDHGLVTIEDTEEWRST